MLDTKSENWAYLAILYTMEYAIWPAAPETRTCFGGSLRVAAEAMVR